MAASLRYLAAAMFFTVILFPESINSIHVCRPCASDAECNADPLFECKYGEVRDACQRRVCGHGPGEKCGGPLHIMGQCGEGMMCRNERCVGCSLISLQCFTTLTM